MPKEIARRFAALLDKNLADMNANAIEHWLTSLFPKPPHPILREQRKMRGVARFCENNEERIARGVNFLGINKTREGVSDDRVMTSDEFNRRTIAQAIV